MLWVRRRMAVVWLWVTVVVARVLLVALVLVLTWTVKMAPVLRGGVALLGSAIKGVVASGRG
jgi:hypothetical protein